MEDNENNTNKEYFADEEDFIILQYKVNDKLKNIRKNMELMNGNIKTLGIIIDNTIKLIKKHIERCEMHKK